MRYEPTMIHEREHLKEMARYFRQSMEENNHRGQLVLFSSQRAMEGFRRSERLTFMLIGTRISLVID